MGSDVFIQIPGIIASIIMCKYCQNNKFTAAFVPGITTKRYQHYTQYSTVYSDSVVYSMRTKMVLLFNQTRKTRHKKNRNWRMRFDPVNV